MLTSGEQKAPDTNSKYDYAYEHLVAGERDTGPDAQRAEDEPEISSVHGWLLGVLTAHEYACIMRPINEFGCASAPGWLP